MFRENEYKGKRCGDLELAEQSLFSASGVNDDELAEIIDYKISPESAVLWCRRQDARRFKREKSEKNGAMIFSLPVEGENKPRYFDLEVIKRYRPNQSDVIRKRKIRALKNDILSLFRIVFSKTAQHTLFDTKNEIHEIVSELVTETAKEFEETEKAKEAENQRNKSA